MTKGFDETSSAMALAKQYLMSCNGAGDITLPKESLKLMLEAFVGQWKSDQDRKRNEFKKAAN